MSNVEYPTDLYPLPWSIGIEERSDADVAEIARERARECVDDGDEMGYEEALAYYLDTVPRTVYVVRDATGFPIGQKREDLHWLLAWLPTWMLPMPQDDEAWGVKHQAALATAAMLTRLHLAVSVGGGFLTRMMDSHDPDRHERERKRWPDLIKAVERWREREQPTGGESDE